MSSMEKWWISCRKFTVFANVQDGRIIDTAPICRVFIGQSLEALLRWFEKFGEVRKEAL